MEEVKFPQHLKNLIDKDFSDEYYLREIATEQKRNLEERKRKVERWELREKRIESSGLWRTYYSVRDYLLS